jgi:lipid-A-disaccharide synthase
MLPGSRRGEVARLLPIFAATVERLATSRPELRVAIPTVATVKASILEATRSWPRPPVIVDGNAEKYGAFAASAAALAASGTVALELAMARLPAVIAYRVNPVSGWLLKRIVKVPYANLVNLLVGREAVPEMLLERCTPEALSSELVPLFDDPAARAAQLEAYEAALTKLGAGGPSPSLRAADEVLRVIGMRPGEITSGERQAVS